MTEAGLYWTYGIAAFCVANTIALIHVIWRGRNEVTRGRFWARAPGAIIESKVAAPATHSDDDGYTPTVRFSYSVAGKAYESDRIAHGTQPSTTRLAAENLVAKYPAGAKVRVLYDPNHPKSAVLQAKCPSRAMSYVPLVVFGMGSIVFVSHSIAGKMLTTPNGVPLFAFLLLLFPLAGAVVTIGNYFQLRRARKASVRWPTVMGTIVRSEVVEKVRTEEHNGRSEDVIEYYPQIDFRYRIGGHDYLSNHRKWGWDTIYSMQESAAARLASYPVGATVPVYYDPADPKTAVLEPASHRGMYGPLLFASISGGLGVFFMWALIMIG